MASIFFLGLNVLKRPHPTHEAGVLIITSFNVNVLIQIIAFISPATLHETNEVVEFTGPISNAEL